MITYNYYFFSFGAISSEFKLHTDILNPPKVYDLPVSRVKTFFNAVISLPKIRINSVLVNLFHSEHAQIGPAGPAGLVFFFFFVDSVRTVELKVMVTVV